MTATSSSYKVSIHAHDLVLDPNDNGWACDGKNLPGGCKKGCTGFYQTTDWKHYSCRGCNFDLCEGCLAAYPTKVGVHNHPVYLNLNDNGWACDGQKLLGGCKKGCTGFRQTKGWLRFTCKPCDYDLCEGCYNAYNGTMKAKTTARLVAATTSLPNTIQVCVHPHELELNPSDNGWACDGRKLPDGCRKGCTGFRQTKGWMRYSCKPCDFDLCEGCAKVYPAHVKCHPHTMERSTEDNGWACDVMNTSAGCKKGCTGFYQTSGWFRATCLPCGYDLCVGCLEANAVFSGSVDNGPSAADEEAFPRCQANHLMTAMTKKPSSYGGSPRCDECRKAKLENSPPFYHCNICSYDLCRSCASAAVSTFQAASENASGIEEQGSHSISFHVLCNKAHVMTQIEGIPTKYRELFFVPTVNCDQCGSDHLQLKGPYHHCNDCHFDLCASCSPAHVQLGDSSNAASTAAVKCQRDHDMMSLTTLPVKYVREYGADITVHCDICRKQNIHLAVPFFHCDDCNFDLCRVCASTSSFTQSSKDCNSNALAAAVIVCCTSGHPLQRFVELPEKYKRMMLNNPSVNCDECRTRSIHLQPAFYHCDNCNYDLCETCYTNKSSMMMISGDLDDIDDVILCPQSHPAYKTRGLPPKYASLYGPACGVLCSTCGRGGLQRDESYHHCDICDFDLCLTCHQASSAATEAEKSSTEEDEVNKMYPCISYIVNHHEHPLIEHVFASEEDYNGWACDGRNLEGGCRSGCTDFYQTRGWRRFNCSLCNFDYCEECLRDYKLQVKYLNSVGVETQRSLIPNGYGGDTGMKSHELFYCGKWLYECRCGQCDGSCGVSGIGCPCNACKDFIDQLKAGKIKSVFGNNHAVEVLATTAKEEAEEKKEINNKPVVTKKVAVLKQNKVAVEESSQPLQASSALEAVPVAAGTGWVESSTVAIEQPQLQLTKKERLQKGCENGDRDTVQRLLLDPKVAAELLKERIGEEEQSYLHIASTPEIVDILLNARTDIEGKDSADRTPLHAACIHGNTQVAERLIERGAWLDSTCHDGLTPLEYACQLGHVDVANVIMKKKPLSGGYNKKSGTSPLHEACKYNQIEIVRFLMTAATNLKVDIHDVKGSSALAYAVTNASAEIVQLLLDKGAVLDDLTEDDATALHLAAASGNLEILNLFLNLTTTNEMLSKVDRNGYTILMYAVGNKDKCNLQVVEAVIQAWQKSDISTSMELINARDSVVGASAFLVACKQGLLPAVQYLVKINADANITDVNGDTGLHFASQSNSRDLIQYLIKSKLYSVNEKNTKNNETSLRIACKYNASTSVKTLIELGIDRNANDRNGFAAIHRAVMVKDTEDAVMQLIHGKVFSNDDKLMIDQPEGDKGSTALMIACTADNPSMARLLCIEGNAKVNKANWQGYRPIHRMCSSKQPGFLDIIKELYTLQREDFDVNEIERKTMMTLLHVACKSGNLETVRFLLRIGANVDAVDKEGKTSLHHASNSIVTEGPELIELLIDYGARLESYCMAGTTALHLACEKGLLGNAEALIDHDAKIEATDNNGRTSFHYAVREGHVEITSLLISMSANVDAVDSDGNTSLHVICEKPSFAEIGKMILDANARIDLLNNTGQAPLHIASRHDNIRLVDYLLMKDAKVGATDKVGLTSLHYAAKENHVIVAEKLLSKGAKIDAIDSKGRTPLHYSCEAGWKDVAHLLLVHGAKADAPDSDGEAALNLACRALKQDVAMILISSRFKANPNIADKDKLYPLQQAIKHEMWSLAQELVTAGAKIDIYDKKTKKTPLHIACEADITSLALSIIAVGKEDVFNKEDSTRMTALAYAAKNGNLDIVQSLLAKNIKVDSTAALKNCMGYTPLHFACEGGHVFVAQALIEAGVDVKLPSKEQKTPFYLACCAGKEVIVKLLLDRGVELQVTIGKLLPMHEAASNGHVAVVQLFIAAKVDLKQVDMDGRNLLHRACRSGHVTLVQALLEEDRELLFSRDNMKYTPMLLACKGGHVETVQYLLTLDEGNEGQGLLEVVDAFGVSPLHHAAECGNLELIQLIHDSKSNLLNLSLFKQPTFTPLHHALHHNQPAAVVALLELGADLKKALPYGGFNELIAAILADQRELVLALLAHGVKTDSGNEPVMPTNNIKRVNNSSSNNVSKTALCAASEKGWVDVIQQLLTFSTINVDETELSSGRKALHIAAHYGHLEIVDALVTVGDVKIDALSEPDRETALHIACKQGHADIALFLITQGASVLIQNKSMQSALQLACRSGLVNVVRAMVDKIKDNLDKKPLSLALLITAESSSKIGNGAEIASILINAGANLNEKDPNKTGKLALHIAAERGAADIVALILQRDRGQVTDTDFEHNTALHLAVSKNPFAIRVVSLLLEYGADINAVNGTQQMTALHIATSKGKSLDDIAALLVEYGASMDSEDKHGKTAVCHACEQQGEDFVAYMAARGAKVALYHKGAQDSLITAGKRNTPKVANLLLSNIENAASNDRILRHEMRRALRSLQGSAVIGSSSNKSSSSIQRSTAFAEVLFLHGATLLKQDANLVIDSFQENTAEIFKFFGKRSAGVQVFFWCLKQLPEKMIVLNEVLRLVKQDILDVALKESPFKYFLSHPRYYGEFLELCVRMQVGLHHLARISPNEERDLKAMADRFGNVIIEFFACDTMDDRQVVLQALFKTEYPVPVRHKTLSLGSSLVLSYALKHGCKPLFEVPQVNSIVNNLFWVSWKKDTHGDNDVKSIDSGNSKDSKHGYDAVNITTNEKSKVTKQSNRQFDVFFALRFTPFAVVIFDVICKSIALMLVSLTIFDYGVQFGRSYNTSQHQFVAWTTLEICLIIHYFADFLHELGELFQSQNHDGQYSSSKNTVEERIMDYFSDEWNYVDTLVDVGGLTWFILRCFPSTFPVARVILSLLAIPHSLGLLRYLSLERTLGELVIIIRAMLWDLFTFLTVYLVIIMGFAIAFRGLFHVNSSYSDNSSTFLTLFSGTLGNFEFDLFSTDSEIVNSVGIGLTVTFVTVTAILLINLLIARMSDSFSRISQQSFREWSYDRAKMVKKHVLLKEDNVYSMLPAPLNLFPIVLTCGGVFARVPVDNNRFISVAGTISNFTLFTLLSPLHRLSLYLPVVLPAFGLRQLLYFFNASSNVNANNLSSAQRDSLNRKRKRLAKDHRIHDEAMFALDEVTSVTSNGNNNNKNLAQKQSEQRNKLTTIKEDVSDHRSVVSSRAKNIDSDYYDENIEDDASSAAQSNRHQLAVICITIAAIVLLPITILVFFVLEIVDLVNSGGIMIDEVTADGEFVSLAALSKNVQTQAHSTVQNKELMAISTPALSPEEIQSILIPLIQKDGEMELNISTKKELQDSIQSSVRQIVDEAVKQLRNEQLEMAKSQSLDMKLSLAQFEASLVDKVEARMTAGLAKASSSSTS